jgi:hypothetical protein
MARKKRSRKRSRGNTLEAVGSSRQIGGAKWSDLEQAFFAAAPPDEPVPAPEAPRFDDLSPETPRERMSSRLVRRLMAVLSLARSSRHRRAVAVALASVCVLICLSAFAVVLRSVTRSKATVEPASPASTSGARGRGTERERSARIPARS